MAQKAALVEQIKILQRSDPETKQVWWDFADSQLGGIRDPNRHDESALRKFLSGYGAYGRGGGSYHAGYGGKGACAAYGAPQYAAPQYAAPPYAAPQYAAPQYVAPQYAAPSGYGAGAGAFGGAPVADMAGFIKTGQKSSRHWKAAWQAYCHAQGSQHYDPSRYDEAFIMAFVDYVGQCVEAQLGVTPASGGGAGAWGGAGVRGQAQAPPSKRPAAEAWAPPAKRGARGPAGGNGDPDKASLVDRVKAFQKSSPENKQAWWSFTEENHKGVKDPARHEASVLEEFLAMHE